MRVYPPLSCQAHWINFPQQCQSFQAIIQKNHLTKSKEARADPNMQTSAPFLSTRSGPKIPAVEPFGGECLFRWDKFGHHMANVPYLPNFRSLGPLHDLEEALVGHWLGPGHLGEFRKLCHLLSNVQYALLAQFQVSRAFPWPRRGTCG